MGQGAVRTELVEVLRYFKALGFNEIIVSSASDAGSCHISSADEAPVQDLSGLKASLQGCVSCKLHSTRTNIVFGEGSDRAELMFIGEGPGADEDIQGRPFVGKAGQLLTSLIEKLGLKREIVYIANIVKCRPPNNRDPERDEREACMPYLDAQIGLIRPKVIIALGKIAVYTLMGAAEPITKFSIMKVRGRFFEYRRGGLVIPVMPTYHPSYLLRNPSAKWDVWNDAQLVMKFLREGVIQ